MEQALEELKGYARNVLTAMFPDAVQVEEATQLMCVLETLSLTSKDGEAVKQINVMYDDISNEYALVVRSTADVLADENLDYDGVGELVGFLGPRISLLFDRCDDVSQIAVAWGMLSSVVSKLARKRVKELGEDPDAVLQALDQYFLMHPDA